MKRTLVILLSLCAASAWADVVHVTYRTSAGGTASTVAEATLETGCGYTTVSAPALDGWLFTHWSSSESDPLVVRDAFGRALDAARFTLYQDTTLTAHYVSAAQDADGDGIPDGHELYWYGDLAQGAASDTDGDGFTFAEELANGTNPHFPDTAAPGGVAWSDGDTLSSLRHRCECLTRSDGGTGVLRDIMLGGALPDFLRFSLRGSVSPCETL